MSYWAQKLEELLTIEREKSLPKLPKGSSVSFGSENPNQKRQPTPYRTQENNETPRRGPANDGPSNDVQDLAPVKDPDLIIEADPSQPAKKRSSVAYYKASDCWSCRRSLWWKDRLGNKKCGICHPPGNPNEVEWYDDQAEHFEERAAIIEHEAGLPRTVAEDLARSPSQ